MRCGTAALLLACVALFAWTNAQNVGNPPLCAGGRHSCFLNDTRLSCWGDEEFGNSKVPHGIYMSMACGSWHTCAIRAEAKTVECFGAGYAVQATATVEPALSIAAGFAHSCAVLAADLSLECWGPNDALDPPSGRFTLVSMGSRSACAITHPDGELRCWGADDFGQVSGAPGGAGWTSLSCGGAHCCATREATGELRCWGGSDNYHAGRGAPTAAVAQVSSGEDHACAVLRDDASVFCWGACASGACDPPREPGSQAARRYAVVAAGGRHSCAARAPADGAGALGAIDCWGEVPAGEAPGLALPAGAGAAGAAGSADRRVEIDAGGARAAAGFGGMISRLFGRKKKADL